MQLIRQTEMELRFAGEHRIWVYLTLFPLSWTLIVLFAAGKSWNALVGLGLGGLFTAVFLAAGLWRQQLTVDLVNRTYEHKEGFWPFVKAKSGSLSEFTGVKLTTKLDPGDSESPPRQEWYVNLIDYKGEAMPALSMPMGEVDAYRDLERYARKLKLPAIDQTGSTEVVTKPEELEHAALWGGQPGRGAASGKGFLSNGESQHPPEFPAAPWPHRIEVSGEAARKTIVLPPMDFDPATRRRELFRLVQLGVGIALVISAPFVRPHGDAIDDLTRSGMFLVAIIGGPILIFSSCMALWDLSQSRTRRTTVEDLGDSIRISEKSWRRKPRTALVRKSEIRAVELKPILLGRGTGNRTSNLGACGFDLEIRTPIKIHHLGDLSSREELEWLKQAVTAMSRYQPKGRKQ